jgi:Tfp pilus assembly protein PilN
MIAVGTAFVVALGGVTFLAHENLSHAKSQHAAVAAEITHVQSQLNALQPILDRETQISALQANLHTLLTADVAWQTMINRITANMPAGVALTSWSAQETPPAPVAVTPAPVSSASGGSTGSGSSSNATTTTLAPAPPPPAPAVSGTINFVGTAKDYPTLANWIDAMGKVPQIANVYVTNATKVVGAAPGGSKGLTFTATAEIATAAQSNRLNEYAKAGK